jgi:hypothetical protein
MTGAAVQHPAQREDLLVSVGVAEAPRDEAGVNELVALAGKLEARFRYWELVVVAATDNEPMREAMLAEVPNLRLLRVRPGTSFYERRLAAASEAIGDLVLLTALAELAYLDIVGMVERADAEDALVIGQHVGANPLGPAVAALGRGAGLRIGPHDMLTTAYPRALINIVLAHPDHLLALRFPPLDDRLPIRLQPCLAASGRPPFRGGSATGPKLVRRFNVLHRLMVGSAPKVLSVLAVSALFTMLGAMLFTVYAIVAWATLDHVQEGWLTMSLALSLTAAFLGSAIFGLSIGLQRLIEAVTNDLGDVVIDETSSIELFRKVMDELNVEMGNSPQAGVKHLATRAPASSYHDARAEHGISSNA